MPSALNQLATGDKEFQDVHAQQGQLTNGNEQESNEDDLDSENDDDDVEKPIGGYQRMPTLPKNDFARRDITQLMDLVDSPYLDLCPQYQRAVVWAPGRMSMLVDSLLQNFYVPPVIFNVQEIQCDDGERRFKRTCVDGKQRLTSIREFMHGRIPCHDSRGKNWYYCLEEDDNGVPIKRAKRHLLPEEVKSAFRIKELLCKEYKDLSEREEREIFQRVQLGIPLTQAEAFRATQGEWQTFAQMYEQNFSKVVNLVMNRRASGFQRILICFSQIYECLDPSAADGLPRLKQGIKTLEAFCSNQEALDTTTRSHLAFVFSLFNELVEGDISTFQDHNYVKVKTFAPVELVAVCVLLSQHGADRPKGMLRGDILALREHLRSNHVDLRLNHTVWTTAWNFIYDLERHRGTVDGSTLRNSQTKRVQRTKTASKSASQNLESTGLASSKSSGPRKIASSGRTQPAVKEHHDSISTRRRDQSLLSHPAAVNRRVVQNETLPIYPTSGAHQPMSREGVDLAAFNARTVEEDAHRTGLRGTSDSSSSGSSINMGGIPTASMTAPSIRKRMNPDLGMNSGGAQNLAAKKARLMRDTVVKQEQ